MSKAILHNGVIVPLEPLPVEWTDGIVLDVNQADEDRLDIDAWAEMMNRICADSSPDDEAAMRQAIDEHRCQAKEQVRQQMGHAP